MKTENTLRTVRNSLLCFFMALGAGFLVACGGGGGGPGGVTSQEFPVYLSDAAVQGVEYSSSTGAAGLTGKGGVFLANEDVFEFSIGAITLGSVRLNSDWKDSHVTPADFIGVDDEKAITIARILQGLDEDGDPQTEGISISQNARDNVPDDLFARLDSGSPVVIGTGSYTIPTKADASVHFVNTRKCLFSGGYAGSYRATVASYTGRLDQGQSYFVLEPFANRIRGVEFSDIYRDENDFELVSVAITVGAIGSVITLSPGNELSFVTPRLVTGIYAESDGSETESGTYRLNLVAGNPGATRRIVGVDVNPSNNEEAFGLYVLDYFGDDSDFRGQYYNVETGRSSVLLLTIASGGSWPTDTTPAELVLSGTLGGEATAVTVNVTRVDGGNHGTFTGAAFDSALSGTWCDIGGASGAAAPPPPSPQTPSAPPSASAQSATEILVTWSAVSGATSYNLYRSTVSVGSYAPVGSDISDALRHLDDTGLSAETEYFYRLEACNSGGCSGRSPEVSATTRSVASEPSSGGTLAVAPAQPPAPSASARSDTEIEVTWNAVSGATSYKLYRSTSSGGTYTQVGGDISALRYRDTGRSASTEYFYQLEACNSAGCSATRSPAGSATTQATPVAPSAPSAPSASAQSDTEIEVTWSAVSGATSYKLYRSTSSGGTYTQVGGDISALRYRDTGRSASTEYFYQLEACNSGGCSSRSPAGSATTQATPVAPSVPSAPSASAQSDTEIEVTWNAVSDATSYRLYRSTSSGGTYTRIGGDISALRYLDTGRSASTEYFYQLEACNSVGCSARSPAGSATTESPPVDGQCSVGDMLRAGESCEWKGYTFRVASNGRGSYAFFNAGTSIRQSGQINGVQITFVAVKNGNVWEIEQLG